MASMSPTNYGSKTGTAMKPMGIDPQMKKNRAKPMVVVFGASLFDSWLWVKGIPGT